MRSPKVTMDARPHFFGRSSEDSVTSALPVDLFWAYEPVNNG